MLTGLKAVVFMIQERNFFSLVEKHFKEDGEDFLRYEVWEEYTKIYGETQAQLFERRSGVDFLWVDVINIFKAGFTLDGQGT